MWKPVRDKDKEAIELIKHHARKGLTKELERANSYIKKQSDKLLKMDFTVSMKRRSNARTDLALCCENRDRLERALEILNDQ